MTHPAAASIGSDAAPHGLLPGRGWRGVRHGCLTSLQEIRLRNSSILAGRLALAAVLLGSTLLAACAAPKELVVTSKRSPEASIPLGKVLVVIDYSLQLQAAATAKGVEERLSRWYLPLGEVMSAEVSAAGGTPTVLYVSHRDERPPAGPEYSHVWTQRVTNLSAVSQGGEIYIHDMAWQATIAHRPAPDRPLAVAYDQGYFWRGGYGANAGVDCFHASERYRLREACIGEYRELIAGQLRGYRGSPGHARAPEQAARP